MSAIILNGSLKHQKHLMPIQKILEEELANTGWSSESILLHEMEIKSCIGCFKCWITSPGICSGVKDDSAEEITKKVIQNELLVFLTPLTFGGYSSELKKIIERLLGLLQPGQTVIDGESHHLKRYEHYPSLFAVAVTENVDEEEETLFQKLIERHSRNFYPPAYKAEVFLSNEDENLIRDRAKAAINQLHLEKWS